MKLSEVLAESGLKLKNVGIESYILDSRLLLAFALGVSKENLLIKLDSSVNQNQLNYFWELISRRSQREPVSHIINKREFFGRNFLINSAVLDPRPDSEVLIDEVLRLFPNPKFQLKILELGVGSGCLILTILSEFLNASAIGVDISYDALKIAIANSKSLHLDERAEFICSDWFTKLKNNSLGFDLVISNPPYIPKSEIANLQPEILKYEPLIALDGGFDGLESYRKIAGKVDFFLKPNGFLVLEIGYNQKEQILEIFKTKSKLSFVKSKTDLSGLDRCLIFRKL